MVLISPFVITEIFAIPWVSILTETNQPSAFCLTVTVLISHFSGIGRELENRLPPLLG